jgi:HMG (high mobility group) box
LQRPKSAYFFYLDDIRAEVNKEHPTASIGEKSKVMGKFQLPLSDCFLTLCSKVTLISNLPYPLSLLYPVGAMWNKIKETKEADKYNKKAGEDKARYEKEKAKYDGKK